MHLSQLNELTSPLERNQLQSLESVLTGLSPVQVAWISGYLAGVVQQQAEATPATGAGVSPSPSPGLTVLYASQTGNARSLAEAFGERANAQGLNARVVSMDAYRARDLARERLVVLVVSTHGEGEPPDSAQELYRDLHGKRAPRLEQLQYAVLGLGDSSYEQFCQTAKDFDARLRELGAQPLADRADCDVDYQSRAEEWWADVFTKAKALFPQDGAGAAVVPLRPGVAARPVYRKERPYTSSLLVNQRITADDARADVRHLVLSVDPGALNYAPGDALGVWFRNEPGLVDAVLEATGLSAGEVVRFGDHELELGQALRERLELTRLHPTVVQGWAELSGDPSLQAIVSDRARLQEYFQVRQFLDLVRDFPARPGGEPLARLLRPLTPRLYTIASSQAAYDDEIHLTVGVVRGRVGGRDQLGGCSGFLAQRVSEDDELEVYVVENPSFRLPDDTDTPIVMIGAGTGIAPFRAFLQQRESQGAAGRNWLIFGNRNFHSDFLYQTEWLRYREKGLLHRVDLAFSRDQEERIYVQQRVRENGAELLRWLGQGAHLYVCGATRMGKDVHQALLDVVAEQQGVSAEGAQEFIDHLRREGRYHRDVY